jgi:ribosome-associated heat shock protein Hsp15
MVNGSAAKPSREVKQGDRISVRKGIVTYSHTVLELVSSRQSAAAVSRYMQDTTPQSELDKLVRPRETVFISRERGMGRPTKKERRDIDGLMGEVSSMEDWDDE